MAERTQIEFRPLEKGGSVAFHVDYWDHLGWRDRFAKPEFTSRQQRYAAAWGGDSVYTPSFVVNGKEWRGGVWRNALPATRPPQRGVCVVAWEEVGDSAALCPGS